MPVGAMEVFHKRYDEFKYDEASVALRHKAQKFLQERMDPGPVDIHETSTPRIASETPPRPKFPRP